MKNLFLLFALSLCTCFSNTSFAKTGDPSEPRKTCFKFPSVLSGEKVIKKGDVSIEVLQIQICMLEKGYNLVRLRNGRPNTDKIFGVITEGAIKRVQKDYGLPQTGIVDAATAQVLETLCCGMNMDQIKRKYRINDANFNQIQTTDNQTEQLRSIEAKIDKLAQLQAENDSLRSELNSKIYLDMLSKSAEEDRKSRNTIDTLVNLVRAQKYMIEQMSKRLLAIEGAAPINVQLVDTVNKTSTTLFEVGATVFAQVRSPQSKDLYRKPDFNANMAIAGQQFKRFAGAEIFRMTAGQTYGLETNVFPGGSFGQATLGYISNLNPSSNKFEFGAGGFLRNNTLGTTVYASYEGNPFVRQSYKEGTQYMAQKHPVFGISASADIAQKNWRQLLTLKTMFPIFGDNARIGANYIGHREDGLMGGMDFFKSICHYGGLRLEILPRTEDTHRTYTPSAYVSINTDLGSHVLKYNMYEAGFKFTNLYHQNARTIVPISYW